MGPLPIFAGKVGGLYMGEEIHIIQDLAEEVLSLVICHPVRIAVVPENDDANAVTITALPQR